jgi:hypothetical protein
MLRAEIQPTMPLFAHLLLFIHERCALALALMTALTPSGGGFTRLQGDLRSYVLELSSLHRSVEVISIDRASQKDLLVASQIS